MRVLIAIALVLGATGCPFDDSDGDGTNYVAIDDMPSAYKAAYCEYLARCGYFPDSATCVSASISIIPTIDPDIVYAVHTGRVIYNGNNVKACFDAVAKDTCDQTDANGRVHVAACGKYFTGTRQSGEPCYVDEECISQACAGGSTGQSCSRGSCVGDTAPPEVQLRGLGEPCASNSQCMDGTFCEQDMNVCTTLRSREESCNSSDECGYGLGCVGLTGARACNPLPALGESCAQAPCRDDGHFCDSVTQTCKQIGVAPTLCTGSQQCSPYYPCDFSTGACKQTPALGQPCNSRCFSADTYCDNVSFTCVAVKADGEPCNTEFQCASGFCDFNEPAPVCSQQTACM